MCLQEGLRLHKFVSNSKYVLAAILSQDQAKAIQDLDLIHDALPLERALGIHWCVESDTFQFQIHLKDQPWARRGIFSTVCSVYDPLGFAAPVSKQILQELCKDQMDWDSPLPQDIRPQREQWRSNLFLLESLRIKRCFKLTNFVGANNELERALSEMNQSKINKMLFTKYCDYLKFKMNIPSPSHMVGVWEWQIRSICSMLATLIHQAG